MPNPIQPRTAPVLKDFEALGIQPRSAAWYFIQDLILRADKCLTNKGEVQSAAPVTGRTEGLGTTVQQLNTAGNLLSTDNIAADGTGSPLTGGKRGFVALDTNNRLANSFRNNPANVSNTPTSSTTLSNDGVSTSIPIAASTNQFPAGAVSYNSGSVDPGAFATSYVYADDPTFAGGALAYTFSASPQNQTAAEGRIPFGKIITTGGAAKTGGGNTGGTTPGGGGGRGYNE